MINLSPAAIAAMLLAAHRSGLSISRWVLRNIAPTLWTSSAEELIERLEAARASATSRDSGHCR